mmetsp:Transcript_18918/g.34235  ORF Transcript_18918/g.34235 Transcript_18918/m.34235 type:complete len:104 (+) Transcript_18918:74-385(+)
MKNFRRKIARSAKHAHRMMLENHSQSHLKTRTNKIESVKGQETTVETGDLRDDIKAAIDRGKSLLDEDQTEWRDLVRKVKNGEINVDEAIVEYMSGAPIAATR